MRSENAKEYLNFSQFLKQNRIVHQSSCVYTPKQNGVDERKIDTFLTLLGLCYFIDRYQKNFKVTSFDYLITYYLINRSHPLYCKIKSYILSCTPILICSLCHQRSLGLSVSFIIIVRIRQNLLLDLLKRFLGYFKTQKSYKYFCPPVGQYILPADVSLF